jgi:hypothetical protein
MYPISPTLVGLVDQAHPRDLLGVEENSVQNRVRFGIQFDENVGCGRLQLHS